MLIFFFQENTIDLHVNQSVYKLIIFLIKKNIYTDNKY